MIVFYEGGGGAVICEACGRYIEYIKRLRLPVHQRWKKDKAKRKCRFSGIGIFQNKKI